VNSEIAAIKALEAKYANGTADDRRALVHAVGNLISAYAVDANGLGNNGKWMSALAHRDEATRTAQADLAKSAVNDDYKKLLAQVTAWSTPKQAATPAAAAAPAPPPTPAAAPAAPAPAAAAPAPPPTPAAAPAPTPAAPPPPTPAAKPAAAPLTEQDQAAAAAQQKLAEAEQNRKDAAAKAKIESEKAILDAKARVASARAALAKDPKNETLKAELKTAEAQLSAAEKSAASAAGGSGFNWGALGSAAIFGLLGYLVSGFLGGGMMGTIGSIALPLIGIFLGMNSGLGDTLNALMGRPTSTPSGMPGQFAGVQIQQHQAASPPAAAAGAPVASLSAEALQAALEATRQAGNDPARVQLVRTADNQGITLAAIQPGQATASTIATAEIQRRVDDCKKTAQACGINFTAQGDNQLGWTVVPDTRQPAGQTRS
jgi:chemotaxis protein histidine kinase CheA